QVAERDEVVSGVAADGDVVVQVGPASGADRNRVPAAGAVDGERRRGGASKDADRVTACAGVERDEVRLAKRNRPRREQLRGGELVKPPRGRVLIIEVERAAATVEVDRERAADVVQVAVADVDLVIA